MFGSFSLERNYGLLQRLLYEKGWPACSQPSVWIPRRSMIDDLSAWDLCDGGGNLFPPHGGFWTVPAGSAIHNLYRETFRGTQNQDSEPGRSPKVLERTICFLKGAMPPQVWFRFFQADDNEELGREGRRWKFSPTFSTTNCGAGAGPRSKAVKSVRSVECLNKQINK